MRRSILVLALFFSIAVFGACESALADLADGLIAYYPFSGNASDWSGHGYNGVVSGATLTTDRFGNPSSAYNFDGIDDYIEVPNTNDVFSLTHAWTLAAWVRPFNSSTDVRDDPIVWKLANNNTHEDTFILGWGASPTMPVENSFMTGLERAVDGRDFKIVSGSHNPNEWLHVVGNYDGSELSIYVESVLETQITIGPVMAYTGPAPLRIGNLQNSSGHLSSLYDGAFYGEIDELHIYNRALSASEVTELYNSIEPTVISVPGAVILGSIGLAFAGWLGKRRKCMA